MQAHYFRFSILAFCLALPLAVSSAPCETCGHPVVSGPAAQGEPSAEDVQRMSLIVARALDLDDPAPPPEIRLVPRSRLPEVAREVGGHPASGNSFVALYIPARATILLSDDWNAASVIDQSVLLHELVHHADALTRKVVACPADREALAYHVQASFLESHGETLESAFGIDRFTLFVLTTCGL